jgi:hypothetical protein
LTGFVSAAARDVHLSVQRSGTVGQASAGKVKTVLGSSLKKDPVVTVLYQKGNG